MKTQRKRRTQHSGERGYLMVGLVAAMTVTMIALAAAAPQIKFDNQREREAEMLWRGQEIGVALNEYAKARGSQLPSSLEELVEGVNLGVKKIRFLRPHALCDPMSPCTPGKSNWRLVHPGDPVIASMIQSLQAYMQKKKDNPQLVQQHPVGCRAPIGCCARHDGSFTRLPRAREPRRRRSRVIRMTAAE